VEGCPRVFAIGDVAATPTGDSKQGYPAAQQAAHAAKAICALMRGQPAPLYRGTANAMFVPIGPSGGVGELPMLGGMMLGDFAVSTMKGKDYFVGTVRKIMRAK